MRRVKTADIKVEQKYYPRSGIDNDYLELLNEAPWDTLPLIKVTPQLVLIDGLHRLTKAKLENITEIEVDTEDIPENQILIRAIELNATHGHQLRFDEKTRLIKPLYKDGMKDKAALAHLLGISPRLVQRETSEIDKDEDKKRNDEILDLYLDGWTQEEIGEKFALTHQAVSEVLGSAKKRIGAEICIPDKPQISDVWHFAGCDDNYGMPGFPGRIPGQIIENLFHFYTDVFDLVADPMAGSGTTKDVAKKMYRRCVASDIKPVKEGIIKRNIAEEGYDTKQRRANFIVLDPPYYKKKDKEYDASAISSLSKKEYLKFFEDLAAKSYKALVPGGCIAFIMSNYIDEANPADSIWTWDYLFLFTKAGLTAIREIHCDLTTQSLHPGHVQQFRTERRMAKLTRSIIVFKKNENRQASTLHSEP